jgi:hypothetical protein
VDKLQISHNRNEISLISARKQTLPAAASGRGPDALMTQSPPGSDDPDESQTAAQKAYQERIEAARHIADTSANLSAIAKQHRLEALGYLLDMVLVEAEAQARGRNGRG